MKNEKLASTEIAQSRERIQKLCPAYRQGGTVAAHWCVICQALEQAELDTRERCAQLAVNAIKEIMRDHFPSRMFTQEIELLCVRVAERIRGKV